MLIENKYKEFTPRQIKPRGWLLKQLEIQAKGLAGNLDIIWPDVKDSRWIGGTREGWERVPYWLDGFIPLAFLLDDKKMQVRAKKYIDAVIANQKADGWICPCDDSDRMGYDVWAAFLILKVLVLYHGCTNDERIEKVVYDALFNLKKHINGAGLFRWGASRWFECLIPVFWLYERTNEDWLLELAVLLKVYGTDYKELAESNIWDEPKDEWTYHTHVVNAAMALKWDALYSRISGTDGDGIAQYMLERLMEKHGTSAGHFTGDECLSGISPIQGTELCSIAEAMFSYELLYSRTGNSKWIDRLEMLAFNGLPAAMSPDMWTHQYDQLINQPYCVKFNGKNIFRTNSPDAHIFGLEPNYGCCTANHSQAWPKFAMSTYYYNENSIISAALAPAELKTKMSGINISVELITDYPFKNEFKYIINTESEVEFNFCIRIPEWVESVTVDGNLVTEKENIYKIKQKWNGRHEINMTVVFREEFIKRPYGLYYFKRGPLVYSLKIEEKWVMSEYIKDDIERKFPYCDYEIYPGSHWGYAFTGGDIKIKENSISDHPFDPSAPPVEIEAELAEIDWELEDGFDYLCAFRPVNPEPKGPPVRKKLIPYGCTNLRMTELPAIEK